MSSIDEKMYSPVEVGLMNIITGELEVGFLIHVVRVAYGQVKHRDGRLWLIVLGLESS